LKRLGEVGVVQDLGGGKIKLVESAQNNPAYKQALQAQVNALTATPRSTTSVLTDYIGGYKFFESEGEKKGLMASGIPESKLIAVQRKNGVAEPMLTDAQELEAQKFVKNQIEAGVGTKTQQTQGFAPQRAERTPAYEVRENQRLEKIAKEAAIANDIYQNGKNSASVRRLKDAALKQGIDSPQVTVHLARDSRNNVIPGTIDITGYEMIVTSGGKKKKGAMITRTLTNPEDIAVFIGNQKDAGAAAARYQEGNDYLSGGAAQSAPASSGLSRESAEGWQ
jgi:hypothetical protein